MPSPSSSRSVDPTLAAATGVLRDAVGAIHNLQHLLGSAKVGPKALLRVIPDVRASCSPAMTAAADLVRAAAAVSSDGGSIVELGNVLRSRLAELEASLDGAKRFGAAERLAVEAAVARSVRDLDAALELADLLVEASAASGVTFDARDIVRESASRTDTGSGRGRKVALSASNGAEVALIEANPRFAVRLFAFSVALVTGQDAAARVTWKRAAPSCVFEITALGAAEKGNGHLSIFVPPVIDLSARVVAGAARIARASVTLAEDGRTVSLSLPLAPDE